ncbi:MAG TPA: glutamine amidotransferase [Polyangiaceae bacterium]|nr:glutamine amidotransferase [Polyangiaceae bacterium]
MLSWSFAEDLSRASAVLSIVVIVAWLGWLLFEVRRRERQRSLLVASALIAAVFALLAVLRPARVTARGSKVGPRVAVVVDASRRMLLGGDGGTRWQLALETAARLKKQMSHARLGYYALADGKLTPLSPDTTEAPAGGETDLSRALESLSSVAGERPQAVVVISDGRLSQPDAASDDAVLKRLAASLGVPVHTLAVAASAPPDASIRDVSAAGSAVAHQPLALRVAIGCSGGLTCDKVPVVVRELRRGEPPVELARGEAEISGGQATVELSVTLERAGARVVQVAIEPPEGDKVPENDARIVTFTVARERVRLLHVAGRPTYDVRALRMWLKSDESVDLVAFFILRTNDDDVRADENSELALIPFPVDELFTQHLPSFDAIVLQDIDAVAYRLAEHLPALEAYVRAGGGLIMVGGPASFAGGHYARTPLERALPVEIAGGAEPYDVREFVPSLTPAGRAAAVLRPLRELVGEVLPKMPGANFFGKKREGAIALWEHPDKGTSDGRMPVLVLGDYVDGRTIALGVDGTHLLAFSEDAERTAGRAYGALWDGLLGWLMRDPRYESARLSLLRPCVAGEPAKLSLLYLPGSEGDVELELIPLGVPNPQKFEKRVPRGKGDTVEIDLGKLEPGGYSALAKVGAAPPTRFDFGCEKGGAAWADSRPDAELLARIAKATGGKALPATDSASLPLPEVTEIAAERRSTPLAPPWLWTLGASLTLGVHWLLRRQSGLA